MKIKLFVLFSFFFLTKSSPAQWVFVGFVTGAGTYPSMSVANCSTIVVTGGGNGVPFISRSTNSGVSFTMLGTSGISHELYSVWAKNRDTIFVGDGGSAGGAGGNAKVYRTYNGGVNWTVILSTDGTTGFINGIVFSRSVPNDGIVQSDSPNGPGSPYWVAKTIDGGATWTLQYPPGIPGSAAALNSVICLDSLFYGFGLNVGASRVDLTTNGGTAWNVRTLGLSGSFVSGFAASSDKIYMIAATNTSLPNIARSTNGGLSFSTMSTGLSMGGYCIMRWIPGTSVCYLSSSTGTAGCIAKSTNNGANWTQMSTQSINGIISMDLVYENGVVCGYALASDGSLLRLIENPLGIESNDNTPTEFKLYQNYPNPFNPSTKIKFDIPVEKSHAFSVQIKIYDVLGREIETLIDRQITPGTYEIEWNANSYPSGIYFYELTTEDFTDTKKLIVLK